jgi:hypothetical protein
MFRLTSVQFDRFVLLTLPEINKTSQKTKHTESYTVGGSIGRYCIGRVQRGILLWEEAYGDNSYGGIEEKWITRLDS